jgi:hypothetical protein
VLTCSVTGIDDRDGGKLTCQSGGPFFGMAENNRVSIPAYNPDGIGKGLSLGHGTCFHTIQTDRSSPEAGHGCLEGHPRTSAWFEKKESEDLSLQMLVIIPRRLEMGGFIQNIIYLCPLQIMDGYDMVHGNAPGPAGRESGQPVPAFIGRSSACIQI